MRSASLFTPEIREKPGQKNVQTTIPTPAKPVEIDGDSGLSKWRCWVNQRK
jgi:hypothetical protein